MENQLQRLSKVTVQSYQTYRCTVLGACIGYGLYTLRINIALAISV